MQQDVGWRTTLLLDNHGPHDLTRQMVFIAPAVITAVLYWLIELVVIRRTSDVVPEPVPSLAPSH